MAYTKVLHKNSFWVNGADHHMIGKPGLGRKSDVEINKNPKTS